MGNTVFKAGWPAQIFFYFGAFVIYTAWQSNRHGGDSSYLGAFLIAFPCFLIGAWLATAHRRTAVSDANAIAEWTLQHSLAVARLDKSLPTTLFLRPFDLTDRLRFLNAPAALMTPEFYSKERTSDLETLIAEELFDTRPLVALGEPGEHVGAGRIFSTEDEWFEAVQKLACAVAQIIVIPSANPGTRRELQWLKESGNLGKCILLMPPQPDASETEMDEVWTEATEGLRETGIYLPPYKPEGALFTLHDDGRVRKQQELKLRTKNPVATALRALGKNVSPDPNVETASGAISPMPQGSKARTVPYVLIAGGFILAAVLWPKVTSLFEPLFSLFDEQPSEPQPPFTFPEDQLRQVETQWITMQIPKGWTTSPLDDREGLSIKSADGSIQGILYSIAHQTESADEFVAKYNKEALLNEKRADLKLFLPLVSDVPLSVEVESMNFEAHRSADRTVIGYQMMIFVSAPGSLTNDAKVSVGRLLLQDERLIRVEFGMSTLTSVTRGAAIARLIESVQLKDR